MCGCSLAARWPITQSVAVRHLTSLLILSLAALVVTAVGAQAAPSPRATGVVLSVSGEKHSVRVVQAQHVASLTYRGTLPSAVHAGAQIEFSTSGQRAFRFVVTGRVDHVIVTGTVERDGKRLALRAGDGSLLLFPKRRHPKVGSVAHLTVRFTRGPSAGGGPSTPGTGDTPATAPGAGCERADCTFDVTGSVTAVADSGDVTVLPLGGGAAVTATPGDVATATVFAGDWVHITGTQSAATGVYTLSSLVELPGCDTPDCTITFDATVDDIEADGFSVSDEDGDEYPFIATAAQLSTLQIGDLVHIVAVQDPTTADYRVRAVTVLASDPSP
jgi:hypothetical protein